MKTKKTYSKYDSLSSALEELLKDYPDIMLFDRSRNSATTIKLKGKILSEMERSAPRSYSETWNRYIASYVDYDYRNSLLMSVENETIYSTILDSGEYSFDYAITYEGSPITMRVTFTEVHADRDFIIFGFKNISE